MVSDLIGQKTRNFTEWMFYFPNMLVNRSQVAGFDLYCI